MRHALTLIAPWNPGPSGAWHFNLAPAGARAVELVWPVSVNYVRCVVRGARGVSSAASTWPARLQAPGECPRVVIQLRRRSSLRPVLLPGRWARAESLASNHVPPVSGSFFQYLRLWAAEAAARALYGSHPVSPQGVPRQCYGSVGRWLELDTLACHHRRPTGPLP